MIKGATVLYIETDHLGTPRQLVDAANTVQWAWNFLGSAFGTQGAMVTSYATNLRFPGQYFDAETGLDYNYFRDYDKDSGRYIESDPIGLIAGVNTYAYVASSPVAGIDTDGLVPYFPGCSSGGCHSPPPAPFPPPGPKPGGSTPSLPPGFSAPLRGLGFGLSVIEMCINATKGCPECAPYKKGTIGFSRFDTTHGHGPIDGPHYHLKQVNQRPSDCKCMWNWIRPQPPPADPNWVDITAGDPPLSP
jgi:RHS repeat-associated protein